MLPDPKGDVHRESRSVQATRLIVHPGRQRDSSACRWWRTRMRLRQDMWSGCSSRRALARTVTISVSISISRYSHHGMMLILAVNSLAVNGACSSQQVQVQQLSHSDSGPSGYFSAYCHVLWPGVRSPCFFRPRSASAPRPRSASAARGWRRSLANEC